MSKLSQVMRKTPQSHSYASGVESIHRQGSLLFQGAKGLERRLGARVVEQKAWRKNSKNHNDKTASINARRVAVSAIPFAVNPLFV